MSTKKALSRMLFWMAIAVAFNVVIYFWMGGDSALKFFGGYVIEMSLSMDNLFLFLLVFEAFRIPEMYQSRVLNYGIIGAIILRFIFVMLGVSVVNRFHWILYIFGGILLISGIKMLFKEEASDDYRNSKIIKGLGKIIPVTNKMHGERFFIKEKHILYATPLFAILVLIELSDILFAIDSIPAVFSITTDPIIVYTSNIFAILGLRSMYFLLEKLHNRFCYVKYGVAFILSFTGIKLLILMFGFEISLPASLMIIFGILILSIILSNLFPEKEKNVAVKKCVNEKTAIRK